MTVHKSISELTSGYLLNHSAYYLRESLCVLEVEVVFSELLSVYRKRQNQKHEDKFDFVNI